MHPYASHVMAEAHMDELRREAEHARLVARGTRVPRERTSWLHRLTRRRRRGTERPDPRPSPEAGNPRMDQPCPTVGNQ